MLTYFSRLLGLALCGIAVLGLLSCGKFNGSSARDKTKVTILVGFSTGSENGQIDLHKQLAREFNESNPDIEIEFETVDYANHDQVFAARLADGNPPDLVMPIGVLGLSTYHDAWQDLRPFIERDKPDLSDFYSPTLEALQSEGKILGLPLGVYPSVLYYNEDLFNRGRMSFPPHRFGETDWTYAKLIETARKLTRDRNGKQPSDKGFDPTNIIQYGYDGADWSPWRTQPGKFGGNPFGMSDDFRKAEMDTPAWKAAFRFLYDSIFTWYVRPRSSGDNHSSVYGDNDPLGSNRTAMWESFSWMQYTFGGWTGNFNWNVAAIPSSSHGRPVTQANLETFAIPRAARHPDQAWKVALWMLKPANQSRLCASWACVPARKSLASDWITGQSKIWPAVDWQVFIDSIDYMEVPVCEAWVPEFKKVWDVMEETMNGIASGRMTDPEQAAYLLDARVQLILDAYWLNKKK